MHAAKDGAIPLVFVPVSLFRPLPGPFRDLVAEILLDSKNPSGFRSVSLWVTHSGVHPGSALGNYDWRCPGDCMGCRGVNPGPPPARQICPTHFAIAPDPPSPSLKYIIQSFVLVRVYEFPPTPCIL